MNHLFDFTNKYVGKLNERLRGQKNRALSLYGDPTELALIFVASDGFLTLYLPKPTTDPNSYPAGIYVEDWSKYSLDSVCQATHLKCLKVGDPLIGHPAAEVTPIPPDISSGPPLDRLFFSHAFREESRRIGPGMNLPGVMVAPVVNCTVGIRNNVAPARVKVWSPTIESPGGRIRIYHWTHADFWWKPEELALPTADAESVAAMDLLALEQVIDAYGSISPEEAGEDVPTRAARGLEQRCLDFLTLLDTNGDDEEVIHQWLNRPENHLFIELDQSQVRSKVRFGDKISDFVVRKNNKTYVLVEIERATARIFRAGNHEPSAEFNHARQQVRDWKRYIRENVHTVRNELKLDEIDSPSGMIVMGRRSHIVGDEANLRWRDLKSSGDTQVFTYDDLCDRVACLANALKIALR